MGINSGEIIDYLKQHYPQEPEGFQFDNYPDRNLGTDTKQIRQYIIGAARTGIGGGFSYYESSIEEKLKSISGSIKALAWSYEGTEILAMKATLYELAEQLQINMDVERMIRELDVPKDEGGMYGIVITVITYSILYIKN